MEVLGLDSWTPATGQCSGLEVTSSGAGASGCQKPL